MGFDIDEYFRRQLHAALHHKLQAEEQQYLEELNNLKNKTMAEQKKYKTKIIRVYENKKATEENKQPLYNGYITLENALPAGSYKFGLWSHTFNGETSYDTTKIEPYEPKKKENNTGSQRQSDNQYTEPAPGDLPF